MRIACTSAAKLSQHWSERWVSFRITKTRIEDDLKVH
jgi:hypothetical protein